MNFKELLYRARQGNQEAILEIFEMYRPLLIKNALVEGIFDEDLYQELTAELLKCIRYFRGRRRRSWRPAGSSGSRHRESRGRRKPCWP